MSSVSTVYRCGYCGWTYMTAAAARQCCAEPHVFREHDESPNE